MDSASVRGLEPGRRAAILIHEWQRSTVDPDMSSIPALAEHAASRGATQNIRALAAAARTAGLAVVWSTIEPRVDRVGTPDNSVLLHGLRKGRVVAGGDAIDLYGQELADSDIRIRRVHGLTAFHQTELEVYLRHLGVETVVVCGVSMDIGIPGTALEAMNRGFNVVVVRDCTAASSAAAFESILTHQVPLIATVADAAAVIADMPELERIMP